MPKLIFKNSRAKAEGVVIDARTTSTPLPAPAPAPAQTPVATQLPPAPALKPALKAIVAAKAKLEEEMAPVAQNDLKVVEDQLKDVIQDLYQIMVQVNSYDQAGKPSKDVLEQSVKTLQTSLQKIHTTSSTSPNLPLIPPELLTYVDDGRNPDIYTREFVELARKRNQGIKGKMDAFRGFRDLLAEEMGGVLVECREDIERVLEGTGGGRVEGEVNRENL